MTKIKNNKLSIIIGSLAIVVLIGIVYAVFTQTLTINGTADVRDSKWDIHIVESGELEPSNTLSSSAKVLTKPTASSNSISDFALSLTTPGDSIEYTFHVINDGDYDAEISTLTKNNPICTANGSTSDESATKVCNKLTYTLKYDNGSTVSENDTILSKETKTMKITITYQEFDDATLLPTSNVSITGLGITISYRQKGSAKVNADGTTPYKSTAVQTLLAKVNGVDATYETGTDESHEMYTFEHPATEQTQDLTDYRYIGNDPYNYAKFNCDENGENCEIWRIVGIFTVENGGKSEQRIKLIRDEKLNDEKAWDEYQNGQYENEWSTATLNTYLNGEYYNQVLTENARSMIDPAKYYLGGRAYNSTTNWGSAPDMYTWERGTAVYTGHSTNWTSKVGLLYPSDYTYTYSKGIDNVCYSDGYNCYGSTYEGTGHPELGWLYKSTYWWWLVSPYPGDSSNAFYVRTFGNVNNDFVGTTIGVRPVVYLGSDISVEAGGDGSQNNPYEFVR